MAENQSILDQASKFLFGTLDRVSQGITTYYDGAIKYSQAKAGLSNFKSQQKDLARLQDLESDSAAANWGNTSENIANLDGVNLSTQNILIVAGVALAVFAIARAS